MERGDITELILKYVGMYKKGSVLILFLFFFVISCKKEKKTQGKLNEEGNLIVSVDESFAPIFQEQATAFMNRFPKANIKLRLKAEDKCWQDIADDSVELIITTKRMNAEETNYYKNKEGFEYMQDQLAYDAMILIVNKSSSDTLMTEQEVKQLLKGEKYFDKKIVVDGNSATSSVRYIMDSILKVKQLPKIVHGVKNNEEVIKFVSKTPNAIGFIGFNWIGNPDNPKHQEALKNVSIVKMQSRRDKEEYVIPNYGNIAKGRYPYYRTITYVLKQNYDGLAAGFRNFIMYERGQLIFKRAGFFPARMNFKYRTVNMKELE